ncbi:VanZ family protein [Ekhidna sp.]|uniref:VanZ family protein n=1 Tax=Ekhidna sp. TaxID=2608089 RepID=UPI003CCBBF83
MFNQATIWFVPPILVALGIFLLSTFLAIPIQVEGVGHLDKIEHCFAYFVLTLSLLIAYHKSGKLSVRRSYWLLFLTALYGLFLELIQYSVFPNRFFEWFDAGANVLGTLIGFGVFKFFKRG